MTLSFGSSFVLTSRMRSSFGTLLAAAIMLGHVIVLVIMCGIQLWCDSNIQCTLETSQSFPLMGRAGNSTLGSVRVWTFHIGMMNNTTASLTGYVPMMMITVWAAHRRFAWLARRMALAVLAVSVMLIVVTAVTYSRLLDRLHHETLSWILQAPVPLVLVGCAALRIAVVPPTAANRPVVSYVYLLSSWRIVLARCLLASLSLLGLTVVLLLVSSPATTADLFHTVVGIDVGVLASLGFEVPMCTTTVLCGVVVTNAAVLFQRRMHRHSLILLLPGLLLYVLSAAVGFCWFFAERRRGRPSAIDAGAFDGALHALFVLLMICATIAVLQVGVVALIARSPVESATAGADDDASIGAVPLAVLNEQRSEASSPFEPVPSRDRIVDASVKRVVDDQDDFAPIPQSWRFAT